MNLDAKLSGLIELSCSVRVYVPGTVGVDAAADTSAQTDATRRLLADAFGGATTIDALGSWVSPTAGLVDEHVRVVQSHCTSDQLSANIDRVLAHARTLRRDMAQEAIALEINGKLYLVTE